MYWVFTYVQALTDLSPLIIAASAYLWTELLFSSFIYEEPI